MMLKSADESGVGILCAISRDDRLMSRELRVSDCSKSSTSLKCPGSFTAFTKPTGWYSDGCHRACQEKSESFSVAHFYDEPRRLYMHPHICYLIA
jgi:hypothetical protein